MPEFIKQISPVWDKASVVSSPEHTAYREKPMCLKSPIGSSDITYSVYDSRIERGHHAVIDPDNDATGLKEVEGRETKFIVESLSLRDHYKEFKYNYFGKQYHIDRTGRVFDLIFEHRKDGIRKFIEFDYLDDNLQLREGRYNGDGRLILTKNVVSDNARLTRCFTTKELPRLIDFNRTVIAFRNHVDDPNPTTRFAQPALILTKG